MLGIFSLYNPGEVFKDFVFNLYDKFSVQRILKPQLILASPFSFILKFSFRKPHCKEQEFHLNRRQRLLFRADLNFQGKNTGRT